MHKKHSSQGYITIEILAAAAILLLLVSLSYTPSQAFLKQYHRMQVRIAAQHLASDIRRLQQKALFGNNISDAISITTNLDGYIWKDVRAGTNTTILFRDIGCSDVYLDNKISTIGFTPIGAPNATGSYILKHKQDKDFKCTLTVQVSTGRLDISETS